MDAEQKILGMTIPALVLSCAAGHPAILAAPAPFSPKNERMASIMLKKYHIQGKKIIENGEAESEVWVYSNPDENERKYLVNELKLDEHTFASALDPDELSRLESEPDHTAIIIKTPKNYSAADQFVFKVASAGLFLFHKRLVIVMAEDIPIFIGKPFATLDDIHEILLKMIYNSIIHFREHLKVINMISDEIEKKINISMENKYLINMFTLEKSLVYYLNAVNSNGFVLERLKLLGERLGFSQKNKELLDDIIIENGQCYRQAEINSNILASLMDARVSIVSNNLNILMKTLAAITIFLMVPTLIVSIFSMNVLFPGRDNPHAFWVILGLAIASLGGVLYWYKTRKTFK